jgi:hypothetical protein
MGACCSKTNVNKSEHITKQRTIVVTPAKVNKYVSYGEVVTEVKPKQKSYGF